MMPTTRDDTMRLALAWALPLFATAIQLALWPWIAPFSWLLYFPAVFFSSRLGGRKGGIPATLLSIVLVAIFFMEPRFSLRITHPAGLWSSGVFLVMGVLFAETHERLAHSVSTTLAALAQSESRFKAIVEQQFAGITILRDDLLVYVSPRFAEMFGFSRAADMTGHVNMAQLMAESERERFSALLAAAHADPTADSHALFTALRRDGSHFNAEIYGRAFEFEGQPAYIGMVVDVTTAELQRARFREQAALLDQVSRIAHIGGWSFDPKTGAGTWTREVALIHDLDPSIAPDVMSGVNYYVGESRDAIAAAVKEITENGTPYDLELELESAKGVRKWVRTNGFPIYENGELIRVEGMLQDITEKRRAEDAINELNATLEQRVELRTAEVVAANQELESFAYAVSHDLRAPLRAMSGFANALEEDYAEKLDETARDYMSRITAASTKMSALIDGLLALSRATRGGLRVADVDLSATASALLGELESAEPDRDVTWDIKPGLVVRGDSVMLETALRNLLGNAWKYTSRTQHAHITLEDYDEGGTRWICVRDNGAGFDADYAGRLFQPFQRLHRQDEFAGIGIGLATVQRIVLRHGGQIKADGKLHQGASFCFTLPDVLPDEPAESRAVDA